MNTVTSEYTMLEYGMIIHLRKPEIPSPKPGISLLLHGWTGDENSMNAFWGYLPKNHWLLSPRAPQAGSPAGYAWAQITPNPYPEYDALLPSVEILIDWINKFKKANGLLDTTMNLIGFSQGAAVAYMLAALIPEQLNHVVSIAGFLPDGTLEKLSKQLNHNPLISIFHGAKDRLVPVEMAIQTEAAIKALGYTTHLCVDENTGHKLGPSCVEYLQKISD
jgi:phospholipase/carboxylesterase